ncbi:MAG: hypothetical protein ACD_46C00041G0004, partial [uncultured bacterium]
KVIAAEKKPEKNRVIFSCECINQKNEIVIEGQAEVIAPTKKIRRPKTVLPQIALRRSHSLFADYIVRAKKIGALRAAVIQPIHPKIIEAIDIAHAAGLIDPILIGQKERIHHAAHEAKIDINQYELIDVDHTHGAISKSILMAREDEAGIIIRGGATREELLRAMQKHEKGLLMENAMSYAAVLDVPTYAKALIITDTYINAEPILEVKRDITQNAIDFAQALGIEWPKVAILSGADTINYSMRSTVDAAALCKMAERGQIHGGILDGPLTFDNVISIEVAKSKGIVSPVIGDADILVMPNVETGAIVVKQLEYLAESRNAGLVLGARVPVLMSHINDVNLSTVSCALAILNVDYIKRKYHEGNV